MYKIVSIMAICFFVFIVWIIYLANTGGSSIFFDFVRSIPNGDKLGHIGLFGLLTLLSIIGFRFKSVSVARFRVYYGVGIVLSFVILEELSQVFIPSRTFDLVDMLANIVGIALASIACFAIHRFLPNSTRKQAKSYGIE